MESISEVGEEVCGARMIKGGLRRKGSERVKLEE